MRRFILLLVASLPSCFAGNLLLQKPTLSKTHIVFSYAGDLWSVSRDGGEAKRLTASPGNEADPMFSPDGTQILFTGDYDGNTDVFVMPAAGGTPRRMTYHPGPDFAAGWTPDGGRILFGSNRTSQRDVFTLFTMPLQGAFPEELPLPVAMAGAYSPDGSHIAYVPVFQWQAAWKKYRGGQTRKIWIADLKDSSVMEIPRENSNDFCPMWIGNSIYFLSDRSGTFALYRYDIATKRVRLVLDNKGFDFKSASAGPGGIVIEQFGSLLLFDLATGKAKSVDVKIAADLLEARPRLVSVAKRLKFPDISPNGARAVFEARGEIVSVPADKGDARNLTSSSGVMEREPAWSPDGKWIAYFSDEHGEYQLHVRDQSGMGEVKQIPLGERKMYFMAPRWSPDSKKIAYIDNHLGIWYVDLETKKPVLVDTDYYMADRERVPSWSPDSKWLAFARQRPSHMGAVFLYSLADAKSTQVTDGMSDASRPEFDKDGKYLYFLASTDSGVGMQPDVYAMSRGVSRSAYLVVLAKDLPSPFVPESDEEKVEKKEEKKDSKKEDKPAEVTVKVDFANIGQRILALPIPARRYSDLQVGKAGAVFLLETPPKLPDTPDVTSTVHRYDLTKRRADVIVGGAKAFKVSANGEKFLFQQGERWAIAAVPAVPEEGGTTTPPAGDKGTLKTATLEVRIEPRAEWNQMFREAWRLEREFFYDTNLHGLDFAALQRKYEPFLEGVAAREDLNYLFTEMLGELSVGHMFIGGGDAPETKKVQGGLLGADYKLENGRYRIARIYDGENWNPDLKAPLTQPGLNVVAGEYLLSVNGRELRAADNIYSLFEATAGKIVTLKVGPNPTMEGARDITVLPIPDEMRLRHLAWVEGNRRKVDQLTGGKVGYVYMPDTAAGGLINFNRYFFAQIGKQALIVDERFNHGGSLPTDVVEYLRRPLMGTLIPRDGAQMLLPQGAIFGPKVMITNEFSGSGGDLLPWFFRRFTGGKLIGTRTWGGVVGLSGIPELMDGGGVTAPLALIANTNGAYEVENQGVAPDFEVQMDPKLVRQGADPQLEKAVAVVLEELQKSPLPEVKRPPYPKL